MEQEGFVIKELGKYIEVSVVRESACGSSCETCQAKCAESKPFTLKTVNDLDLKVGDRVKVEMSSKSVIGYMLLVYGLPLVFLLVGTLFGVFMFSKMNISSAEILGLFFGLVIMSVAFFIIKKVDSKYGEEKAREITIKRY